MLDMHQEVVAFLAVRERQKAEREQGLVRIEEPRTRWQPSLARLRSLGRLLSVRRAARQLRRPAQGATRAE